MKFDTLTRAVTEILFVADPCGLCKMTQRIDEHSIEAKEIVRVLKVSSPLSATRCAQICWKVFSDFFSEKDANSCKQWPQIGAAIFWLVENEGKWSL